MASSAVPQSNKGFSDRFWDWFDDQSRMIKKKIAAVDIFDETMAEKANTSPWYALGSMTYLFWMFTIVSGLLLVIYYIPNTSRAYTSILHIQHEVPLGWLMRAVHKYGADAIIIAATLRIYRMYFTGEYKQKEIAWVIAILTLIIGMFSGLTGYLLIWNQRAFWASKVFATFPTYLDQIPYLAELNLGMTTAQFMLGGTAIGEATLTRFYAGHFALSMASLIFVEAYFLRKGFRRISLTWTGIVICFVMVASIGIIFPPELGSRANRAETPLPILSDWYFLGLYQMMKEMKPLYAVIGTMFIPAIALLMPAFDRAKDVSTMKRPFYFMVGFAALLYWIITSVMIVMDYAQITTDPPKLWGSFTMFIVVGALFEYKAVGFRKKDVIKWVIVTWLFWFANVGIYGLWTRFRLPEYSMAYTGGAILTDDDAEKRAELNDRFRGDDPARVLDDWANILRKPIVTEWYVAPTEGNAQAMRLIADNRSVRGWWIMMTMIVLLCGVLVIGTTPDEGIESEIFPSRTPAGKRIKGIRDGDESRKR